MAQVELLRIEPGSPAPWPKDWPSAIGLVVRLERGRVAELSPHHAREDVQDVLARALRDGAKGEVAVSPETPGWAVADGAGSDQALQEVARLISGDADLLEEAQSYALNYDYAASEGKDHLLPAAAAVVADPALPRGGEPEPQGRGDLEGYAPLYELMRIEPVQLVRIPGSPYHVLVRIPGGAVRRVDEADIYARADGRMIRIALNEDMHPGSLLLPEKVLEHLDGVVVPGPVRAVVQGDFLCISAPAAEPRAQGPAASEDGNAEASPRGSRRRAGAVARMLILACLLAALAAAIPFVRWAAADRSTADTPVGIDDLRGALFPGRGDAASRR